MRRIITLDSEGNPKVEFNAEDYSKLALSEVGRTYICVWHVLDGSARVSRLGSIQEPVDQPGTFYTPKYKQTYVRKFYWFMLNNLYADGGPFDSIEDALRYAMKHGHPCYEVPYEDFISHSVKDLMAQYDRERGYVPKVKY